MYDWSTGPRGGSVVRRITANRSKGLDITIGDKPPTVIVQARVSWEIAEEAMAKAYWVVCYRSISDPAARSNTRGLPFLPFSSAVGAISRAAVLQRRMRPES